MDIRKRAVTLKVVVNTTYSLQPRNIGKTQFIKELASTVGTTVSNIYSIIKDATISVKDYNLKVHYELSAMAAFEKRSKNHKIPNNSKFENQKSSSLLSNRK